MKKILTSYSQILLLVLGLSSCRNENTTAPTQENGFLIKDTQSVEIICVDESKMDTTYIIRTEEDYKKLQNFRRQNEYCVDSVYKFPAVDFSKKTLFGYLGSMKSSCSPKVAYSVVFDSTNKTYTVQINLTRKGNPSWNYSYKPFFTIPKIADSSKVRWIITTVDEKCN